MKMRMKMKITTAALAACIAAGGMSFTEDVKAFDVTPEKQQEMQEESRTEGVFADRAGVVEMIHEIGGTTVIRIKDEKESETDFYMGDNTLFTDSEGIIAQDDINEGDHIKCYFVMPQIMTMQYPPAFTANVVVKEDTESFKDVYVGLFDENMLSELGDLKLNVNQDNPILNAKNEPYDGELENKILVVFYSIQTMSIPPQTPPEKIVVYENTEITIGDVEVPSKENEVGENTQQSDKVDADKVPELGITANGTVVEGNAFNDEASGYIMFPLRSICEGLGFDVVWENDTKSVRIGIATYVNIGYDNYTIGRRSPITLGAAPVLIDGTTYVPAAFFTDVLNVEYGMQEGNFNFVLETDTEMKLELN